MKFKSIALCSLLFSSLVAFAQEENVDRVESLKQRVTLLEDANSVSKNLKIGGYIQADFNSTGPEGSLKVGSAANAAEAGKDYGRLGIRRGRLKASYDNNGCQAVFELDATEKGVAIKDMYVSVLDPWTGYFSVRGGSFDRPFGYEVSYSSSRLESAERSRVIGQLFPNEKDLGGMLTIQAPKTSPLNVLKLDAGLFSGGGIGTTDTKSKKDFIGHFGYTNAFGKMKVGLGVSGYYGYILHTGSEYTLQNGAFAANTNAAANTFSQRKYLGFDGQFSLSSGAGLTTLRAEWISGVQPGTAASGQSPDKAVTTTYTDTYIRNVQGGYVHLIQDIADTKHTLAVKYDWYDPNTKLSGDQIGVGAKTGSADIAYRTLGFSYLYRMNSSVRLLADYDYVINEESKNLNGYNRNRRDNVFTLRLQYKF